MCDSPGEARTGWIGWLDAPSTLVSAPNGPWIDLTYSFSENVPRVCPVSTAVAQFFAQMPHQTLNVSRLETIVHVGTHVDSPRHFYADGPGMDQVPLDRLTGEGVVVRIDKPPFGAIEPEDLEAASPQIRAGDIVAICTGWSDRWGGPDWNRHPYISTDAADWLVHKKIKLLAVDTARRTSPMIAAMPISATRSIAPC